MPSLGSPIYHGKGVRYSMDRELDIRWVSSQDTMGRMFDIPRVRGQNTRYRGFNMPLVGGLKYYRERCLYTMIMVSIGRE